MSDTPSSSPAGIPVWNPEGELVTIPALDQSALLQGYRQATPEDVHGAQMEARYGGLGQQAITGLEGAAKGLSFGLSTPVERAFGVPAEDIAGRAEANPATAFVTELGGMVGGAAIPGSAPFLAEKLGGLGARAVGKALPEATGLLGKITQRAVTSGAGSAIEGTAFGLGQVVSEASLGDPNLTGQSAIAQIGLSGLLFGVIGSGSGAGAELLGKAAEKAPAWLKQIEGWAGPKQLGATKSQMTDLLDRYGLDGTADVFANMREEGVINWSTQPAEAAENSLKYIKKNAGEMDAMMKRLDQVEWANPSASANGVATLRAVRPEAGALMSRAQKEIIEPMLNDPLSRPAGEKLQKLFTEYAAKVSLEAPSYLLGLRRTMDEAINYSQRWQDLPGIQKGYSQFRRFVNEELQSTIKRAERLGFDVSIDDWKQLNKNIAEASVIRDLSEQAQGKLANNLFGLPDFIAGDIFGHVGFGTGLIGGVGAKLSRKYGSGVLGAGAQGLRQSLEKNLTERALGRAVGNPEAEQFLAEKLQASGDAASHFTEPPPEVRPPAPANDLYPANNPGWKSITPRGIPQRGISLKEPGEHQPELKNPLVLADRQAAEEFISREAHLSPALLDDLKIKLESGAKFPFEKEALDKYLTDAATREEINGHLLADDKAFPAHAEHLTEEAFSAARYAGHDGIMTPTGDTHAFPNPPAPAPVAVPAPSSVIPPAQSPESVAALATLEKTQQALSKEIDSAASALVRGVVVDSEKTVATKVGDALIFGKHIEHIQRLAQNPAGMLDALVALTDDLHIHAPQTSLAMQIATVRAIEFMASKVPQPAHQGPLAPDWQPSPTEIARFNRYLDAVNHPTAILKQAAAGTLTPEAVEAVKTVYPQLFMAMQAKLIDQISRHLGRGHAIPYRSRLAMGMILGRDLDGSTAPGMVVRNQATMRTAPANAPRPSASGAGKLTLAERMKTDIQASADRKRK